MVVTVSDGTLSATASFSWTVTHTNRITYYVDNTNAACSDTGAGTSPSLPFCTLTKGAAIAVAGDTVRVLAGTYAEVVKPNSGTAGNPVTFSAAPGVIVTGPPGNSTNGGAFRITVKELHRRRRVHDHRHGGLRDHPRHIEPHHDLEQPRELFRHGLDPQNRDLPERYD